jgi:ribosomal protein L33
MVSVVRERTIDVHNYERRLARAVRFLENHAKVNSENKRKILEFLAGRCSGKATGGSSSSWITPASTRAEIKPFHLRRYAPKLNEVDTRINRALKHDICSNHNYRTTQNLTKAARLYLRQHNRKHKLRDLSISDHRSALHEPKDSS